MSSEPLIRFGQSCIASALLCAALAIPARAAVVADVIRICSDPRPPLAVTVERFERIGWQRLTPDSIPEVADLTADAIILSEFKRIPLPDPAPDLIRWAQNLSEREKETLLRLTEADADLAAMRQVVSPPDGIKGSLLLVKDAPGYLLCAWHGMGQAPDLSEWGRKDTMPGPAQNANPELVKTQARRSVRDPSDASLPSVRLGVIGARQETILTRTGLDMSLGYTLNVHASQILTTAEGDAE